MAAVRSMLASAARRAIAPSNSYWLASRSIHMTAFAFQEASASASGASSELPPNLIIDDMDALAPPTAAGVPATCLASADLHFHERSTLAVKRFADAEETGESASLNETVFNAPLRMDLVHRVARWQLAQGRTNEYSAAQRGELRGSTRKMTPQKGQGRARQGMRLVPGRYGGPKAHPPRARSWQFDLPRKVRQGGLRVILSAKASEGRLHIVDSLDVETHKTRALVDTLASAWGVQGKNDDGRAVLVTAGTEVHPNLALASRGVQSVLAVTAMQLTPIDLLRHPNLFLTPEALEQLTQRLA